MDRHPLDPRQGRVKRSLQATVEQAIAAVPRVRWSIAITHDGRTLAAVHEHTRLRTASMGKVFLLVEVARRFADGSLDPTTRLDTQGVEPVADCGLWQHFPEVPLTVGAAAVLVASVSDNLATNVLLDLVSLTAVSYVSEALGMPESAMLDRIRDERTGEHPVAPSMGRAIDLAHFMEQAWHGNVLDDRVGNQVRHWLSLGTDLSMVAGAFNLDPLAHAATGPRLINKTGTDAGVRADAGAICADGGCLSYAVIANWTEDPGHVSAADEVMAALRAIGTCLRDG